MNELERTKNALVGAGINPNKALGQNFLVDESAIKAIVAAACVEGRSVVEIGSGLGALTLPLCKCAASVTAVELDKNMADALRELNISNLEIINQDFLKIKENALPESFYAVGNLPYYITTPICIKLLSMAPKIESMTLMMQREAAAHIFAKPGTKQYGAMSVMSNTAFEVKTVLELSPSSYFPQPEVSSVVLHFAKKEFDKETYCGLRRTLTICFLMRRKTLLNNLLSGGYNKETATVILSNAGISPTVRAETLLPEDFMRLTRVMNEITLDL